MPIIASASGETRRIIDEAKCGICCPLGDAEALAEAILNLKNSSALPEMAQNALRYSEQHFGKETILDLLESKLCGGEETAEDLLPV